MEGKMEEMLNPLGSTSVENFAIRHQLSESTVRREIREGLLEAILIRGKTRITLDAEKTWLAAQPKVVADQAA